MIGSLFLVFFIVLSSSNAAEEIKFEEAIHKIIARNPSIRIQSNNLEMTYSRTLSSRLAMLPNLSLQAGQGYSQVYGQYPYYLRTIQGSADVNLFKFGSDLSAMRAAKAEVDTQSILVEDSVIKAEAEGIQSLVSLIQSQMTLDVLERMAEIRSNTLKIARERYQQGLLPSQEAERVSVDYENSLASLRDAQTENARARAALEELLGDSNVQIEWPWKEKFLGQAPGAWKLDDEPDLSKRPDWRAAQRATEAADHRLGQSWGKMLPSLDFNFSYGVAQDLNSGGGNVPQMTAALNLTIPLFDRLSNYGDYRAQVYARSNSELGWLKIKRLAKKEWEAAQKGFLIALETAKSRDKTVTTSRKLYETNMRRFKEGLTSANDLVIDQDRLYNSELFAIKGWASVHIFFSDRTHALGKRVTD